MPAFFYIKSQIFQLELPPLVGRCGGFVVNILYIWPRGKNSSTAAAETPLNASPAQFARSLMASQASPEALVRWL